MINQNWIFGTNAGVSFTSGTPVAGAGYAINTGEGCASISDVNGNLLFYTDGRTVWDANNNVKMTGLSGHDSSTQSAIIVPDPGNTDEYYVFTTDVANGTNGIGAAKINVVTWQNTLLNGSLPSLRRYSATEKITAIQHANCKDFWVVTVLQNRGLENAGVIRVLSVTSTGISFVGDTDLNTGDAVHDLGYLKGSPDGQKIAFANWNLNNIRLLDFNHSTGAVNLASQVVITAPNPLPLSATNSSPNSGHERLIYGLEFSPDSQLLYYSVIGQSNSNSLMARGYIYQVDVTSNSQVLISTHDNNDRRAYALGAIQQGPDQILYIAQSGESYLGAINQPNTVGIGCNLVWNQVALVKDTTCKLGLPNLIPNPCPDDCNCGCHGCNSDAEAQNEELISRAKGKQYTEKAIGRGCDDPFVERCKETALNPRVDLEPCFYFHWGDGPGDRLEEHDTEVFYLTICNKYRDIQYDDFRITKVTLVPTNSSLDEIHIVPSHFICLDCLLPCSCQTREFAIITRANNIAGGYRLVVEYCYAGISLTTKSIKGKAQFKWGITED